MKNLLQKEFRLAIHPMVFLFWLLSAMLIIPSYPYSVVFFYTTLGLFFVCLTGRENHDIEYSISLPVRKRDIVRTRFLFAVIVELAQLVIAVPFAMLRQRMPVPPNEVGMEANVALFAFALVLYGVFNLTFFTAYYRAPDKVGKAFAVSSILVFALIIALEALTHIVPLMRDQLDTPDPRFMGAKLAALGVGAVIFALCTTLGCKRSADTFEKLDLQRLF